MQLQATEPASLEQVEHQDARNQLLGGEGITIDDQHLRYQHRSPDHARVLRETIAEPSILAESERR